MLESTFKKLATYFTARHRARDSYTYRCPTQCKQIHRNLESIVLPMPLSYRAHSVSFVLTAIVRSD
jgi:hypothetical protein